MPKIVTPLRDTQIASAKPKDKDYSLPDGGGLFLLVKTTGVKAWRFRYFRPDGRRNMLALGDYPQTGLAAARQQRDALLVELRKGTDPRPDKGIKPVKAGAASFQRIADDWLAAQKKWSEDHHRRVAARFHRHLYPTLGALPAASITTRQLIDCLLAVEAAGFLDVAARMRQQLVLIFRAAKLQGLIEYSPAQDLIGSFSNPQPTHRPALPLDQLPQLLHHIHHYSGRPITRFALLLSLHLFVRSSELRYARRDEFDLTAGLWTIPAKRAPIEGVKYSSRGAKMQTQHLVPLSPQVVAIITELNGYTGNSELLLPGDFVRTKPISENTVNKALRRFGYCTKTKVCGHGFRTMACGALNESGLFSRDAIERQMSHQERDGVRAAYIHKAEFLHERKRMMRWWSDYLQACEAGCVNPWDFQWVTT